MTGATTWGGGAVTSRKGQSRAAGCMTMPEIAKSNDLYCNQNFDLRGPFEAGQTINYKYFMTSGGGGGGVRERK